MFAITAKATKIEITDMIIVKMPNTLPAPAIPDFEPLFLAEQPNTIDTMPIINSIKASPTVNPKRKFTP